MTVGTPPGTGFALVDGAWLNGLAGGVNQTTLAGVNLTVNSQTAGFFLPSLLQLVEVDTSVSGGSITLPLAVAGSEITIFNNATGATINVFANPNTNQLTGTTDKIQTTNTTTIANNAVLILYCVKNGLWLFK